MLSLRDCVESNEIIVAAHRGSSAITPENTIAAYRQAIEDGARMIEIDIHITKDGNIVALHDLGKFQGYSEDSEPENLTLKQLKEIDVGSWFDSKFKNERIPTIEEVIDIIKGKIFLNIEIKNSNSSEFFKIFKNIIEIIQKANIMDQVLFCSFYYDLLIQIKQIAPDIPTAAIQIPNEKRLPSEIMSSIGCDAYICSVQDITNRISEDVKKNHIFLGVYAVDDVETLDYILNYNITAIGTNNPALIIKELKRRKYKF